VSDFADEAERLRRAGDARAAVETAEAGLADEPDNARGRIVLALALLDLGDPSCAREQLETAFPPARAAASVAGAAEPIGLTGEVGDDELESAFALAETDPDEMMSANKVVEQTLENEHVDVPEAGFDVTESPTYATETLASILEEQGRVGDAQALREALVRPDRDQQEGGWGDADVGPAHAERLRVLSTLESWLHNIRRHAAYELRDRERAARGTQSS